MAGPRQRRWIRAELAGNLVVTGLVVTVLPAGWARYHVVAMAVGQCLTAFFAVWTVEHHLFPAVPTSRLPVLARRLDAVAPELAARKVF